MNSIGLKLWGGMMALIMVVLLLLWLFQIVFLENFYNHMRISEIKNEGVSIIKLLADGNNEKFEDKLDAFAFSNNLSVEMVDPTGKSIYTTGSTGSVGHMPMMMNSVRVEVFQEILAGKETIVPLTHPRFGNKFILIGLPVKFSGDLAGVLLINLPLAPVEDTAAILKKQLFIITLILLVTAVIISFMISRTFTKPILEIKKVSEGIAAGDFSHRIISSSKDEIGKLAETINHMGQQLSKVEQLRKDLIANVSHELRTPLSLIRGYAETIRDVTGHVTEKREKQLGIIIEESERLGKIVDDILNLSQLQSGYSNLNKSHFLIMKVLDSAIKRYDVLSEKTGVNLVLQGSSDGIVVADETRIEQVLYNLINNGFNHTPKDGTITVKAIDKSNAVRVEVSDTGSGIPEEDLPNIWDRYYKVKKNTGKRTAGTGLGLTIVKGVLEAHQAAYGVESKKDIGTTFWFELRK